MAVRGLERIQHAFQTSGWVRVPQVVSPRTVAALQSAVSEITAAAAHHRASTDAFDICASHLAAPHRRPQLRKIKRPHLWHPSFNAIIDDAGILDVVGALLLDDSRDSPQAGRDSVSIRFQGDKVVVKGPVGRGQPVVCHQDWAFYPHTNDSMCTVSVILCDVTLESGGLAFVPGSHRGDVFSHHCSKSGEFIGGIEDARFDPRESQWDAPECHAGDIIVHHARTVHASGTNTAAWERPQLLLQYCAGDSWPLAQHARGAWGIHVPSNSTLDEWQLYQRGIVRGCGSPNVRVESVPASVPLPWPARGSLGSLYRQTRTVSERKDGLLDTTNRSMRTIPAEESGCDAIVAPGGCFARLASAAEDGSEDGTLEWIRVQQFVGEGPYGSLKGSVSSFSTLRNAFLGAVASSTIDDDVYDGVRRAYWDEVVGSREHAAVRQWDADRTDVRAREVAELVNRHCDNWSERASERSMLDIGCADGRITAALGKHLGMSPHLVFGCDTRTDMHVGNIALSAGFVFSSLQEDNGQWNPTAGSNVLPFADESLDLVTALMTLHHVRDLKGYLDDVFRVLRPGGLFVIRDHDCVSPLMADVLDVVHGMHFRVWPHSDSPNYKPRGWLADNFQSYYHSWRGWHRMVTAAGLAPASTELPLMPSGGARDTQRSDPQAELGLATTLVNPKGVFFGVYVK